MKKIIIIICLLPFLLSAAPYTDNCFNEADSEICDNNDVADGYWWQGYWVPGMVTYQTQFLELPNMFSGAAVFYGPYVMEGTARYRGLDMSHYLGGVALMTCSEIGSEVWIMRNGVWEGLYLVVDCPRRNDLYGIAIYRDEVVEVDFNTALRWKMVEQKADYSWSVLKWKEEVIVSRVNPFCSSHTPVDLSIWLEPRMEYAPYLDIITTLYEPPFTWRVDNEWITYQMPDECTP